MRVRIDLTTGTAEEKRWIRLAARRALEAIPAKIKRKLLKRKTTYPLFITLISADAMKKLNKQYRGKNRATDVLSFSRLEGATTPMAEVGDLVLCPAVAKKQAKENGVTYKYELQMLAVHGVLHLFGYDHETSARDAKVMFALQEKVLATLT